MIDHDASSQSIAVRTSSLCSGASGYIRAKRPSRGWKPISIPETSFEPLNHADHDCRIKINFNAFQSITARHPAETTELNIRHCERSEAIHLAAQRKNGLLRFARNDD
ncbi:MAG: hypothetical protein H0V72_12270 [Bradyrhizobium sp.]|nr:hypothetical protein [Bradyrhizobium sp.]